MADAGKNVLSGTIRRVECGLLGAILDNAGELAGTVPGDLVFYTPADMQPYEGEYEVTPSVQAQTLSTAGKLLQDDITITEIPFAEVSNTSGGTTVTIGKEV